MSEKYLENVKFLVVDDNAFMRNIVRKVLNIFGAEKIDEASDGAEATQILKTSDPDIIICDWEMRPVDGMEFVKVVRTSAESPNIFVPIIMLSGHSETSRVTAARDFGVNEFVVKPFSASSLFDRIEAVIARPRPFVRAEHYFGPDRRRHNLLIKGPDRRTGLAKAETDIETEEAQTVAENTEAPSVDAATENIDDAVESAAKDEANNESSGKAETSAKEPAASG